MDEAARLRDMVPSAYLRVFQPLDAFAAEEQAHWERYLLQGARSPAIRARYRDRARDDLAVERHRLNRALGDGVTRQSIARFAREEDPLTVDETPVRNLEHDSAAVKLVAENGQVETGHVVAGQIAPFEKR